MCFLGKKVSFHRHVRDERGISMTEMILYLAIAVIIIVASFEGYRIAKGTFDQSGIQSAIGELNSGISGLYGNSNNYAGITAQTLSEAGKKPSGWSINSNGDFVGSWGGTVYIQADSNFATTPGTAPQQGSGSSGSGSGPAANYDVFLTGLSQGQCIQILSENSNPRAGGWPGIGTSANSDWWYYQNGQLKGPNVSTGDSSIPPADFSSACVNGQANTVILVGGEAASG